MWVCILIIVLNSKKIIALALHCSVLKRYRWIGQEHYYCEGWTLNVGTLALSIFQALLRTYSTVNIIYTFFHYLKIEEESHLLQVFVWFLHLLFTLDIVGDTG